VLEHRSNYGSPFQLLTQISIFSIHLAASIIGETGRHLSMTALTGRRQRRLRSNHWQGGPLAQTGRRGM